MPFTIDPKKSITQYYMNDLFIILSLNNPKRVTIGSAA